MVVQNFETLGDVCVCVCVCVCLCLCVVSLAAPRVRFCSGGLVVYLNDTHEAEPLGRNWYISLTVRLTNRAATDTHEADALARNLYSFLTTGNNSYFPVTSTSFTFRTMLAALVAENVIFGIQHLYADKGSEVTQFFEKIFRFSSLPPAEFGNCFVFDFIPSLPNDRRVETFCDYFPAVAYRGGVQILPPPEILKALQNRAKLNPIVKTVKNC